MRTNVCVNPSFEAGLSSWTYTGTVTQDTSTFTRGTASAKVSTPTAVAGYLYQQGAVGSAAPGDVWTISADIKTPGTNVASWIMAVQAFDASSSLITTYTTPIPASVSVWTRFSLTTPPLPANTSWLRWFPVWNINAGAAGDVISTDGVLMEKAPGPLTYFDGDTINCQWTGAAGSSTSTWFSQRSSTVRKNLCPNPSFEVDASGWTVTVGGAGIARRTDRASAGGVASGLATWATGGAYAQAVGVVVNTANGLTYTVSADVYVPASMPRVVLDVAGIANSVPSSINGGWQRLSVTFTANANTATVRLVCYDAATAGQTANIDRVLVEVGAVAGTYFDGDSANAIWDGTAGASTSQQIVPAGLNPNLPVMDWRVWTGENPPAVPNNPATKPLFLSDRARSLKIERGRQYELDQDQAGVASVVLDNNDGTVIGGRNNMYPMRLGQFRVTYLGQTYVLYTGYVSSWPDKATDPATSEAEVAFVDLMDPLANKPLGPMYLNELLSMQPAPSYVWPFGEAVGSSAASDVMGVNTSPVYPVVPFSGGDPGTLVFGGSGVCLNDSSTALANDNATGPTGKASQVQLSGPVAGRTIQVDTTKPWLASMVFKATAGKSSVFSILDNTGAVFASISFDATTGIVSWYVGGATTTWNASGGYLSGGVDVWIGYDGTSALYGYQGAIRTLAGYTPKGVCSWIAAGACFNGAQIFNGGNSTYSLQYMALWNNGSTLPDRTVNGPIFASYWALSAFANVYRAPMGTTYDITTQRMARVLKWAGQSGLAGDSYGSDAAPYYNTGWLQALPDTKGSAPIDLLRQCALSVLGRFFISKGGLPTFHSKDHGQSLVTPAYVFGSNTAAGELPYTGGPEFGYDLMHVYNDVQVSLPGSTFPSLYYSGSALQKNALYRWVNSTSLGKYFTRVLQAVSHLLEGGEGLYLAQYLANRYGEPDYRIGDIVLDPAANPALWPAVLGLELNDVVQVNHRDLNGTRSGWYQVAKIMHEVDGGDSWKTTLSLTPFRQYWLLGAMHTTLAASCAAGATSITLNPLPDSATNAAEASLGVGTTLQLDPGTGVSETVTIKSVASAPTPRATGYTSITVGVSATSYAHASGAVACDPLPSGVSAPTTWDSRSVLGTTTILNA